MGSWLTAYEMDGPAQGQGDAVVDRLVAVAVDRHDLVVADRAGEMSLRSSCSPK
ncbi:hypothetical protein ACWD4G_22325 [Streptomyces sp. NPDC002643]